MHQLERMNAKDIINDVFLMGGATWLTASDADIFDTVSGDVHHCYTAHDHTLKLYEIHQAYHGKEEK